MVGVSCCAGSFYEVVTKSATAHKTQRLCWHHNALPNYRVALPACSPMRIRTLSSCWHACSRVGWPARLPACLYTLPARLCLSPACRPLPASRVLLRASLASSPPALQLKLLPLHSTEEEAQQQARKEHQPQCCCFCVCAGEVVRPALPGDDGEPEAEQPGVWVGGCDVRGRALCAFPCCPC
jgi:hypothetical protein